MDRRLRTHHRKSHFAVITRGGTEKIELDDILYFESEGRKVHVHTKERKISFNGSMQKVREMLDGRFCCCHGSYEVNLTKVIRLADYMVEVEGGRRLPVSQRRHAEIKGRYQAYLRENFPCNLGDDIV